MLVSHRNNFVYTKTYKTAGTSVESYFEPFCMADSEWSLLHRRDAYASQYGVVGLRAHPVPAGTVWWNHMPASLIKVQLGDDLWEQYFKFCVVRNPYDKVVSEYFFRRRIHKKSRWLRRQQPHPVRFEHWLESSGPTIDRDKYLIDGQFCLNDVIRYETLSADMQRICNLLGLPWEPGRLQKFKGGLRPRDINLNELYTEKARELVQAAFAFELSYFGYSFPT